MLCCLFFVVKGVNEVKVVKDKCFFTFTPFDFINSFNYFTPFISLLLYSFTPFLLYSLKLIEL